MAVRNGGHLASLKESEMVEDTALLEAKPPEFSPGVQALFLLTLVALQLAWFAALLAFAVWGWDRLHL